MEPPGYGAPDLTDATYLTFALLGLTIVLFVTDRVRPDGVALFAMMALAIGKIVPLDVVLSGFANPATLMIAGLFVVGTAISETGVADWLGKRMDRVAGASEASVLVVIVSATTLVSAFMSSTGTVALLLPVVGTLAVHRGIPLSRLLMPMAFAAHLGSNLTLISTPPNLIVSDALRGAGHEPFHFFSFLVPGAAVFLVGLGYLVLVGRRRLPAGDSVKPQQGAPTQEELVAEYGLAGSLVSVRVPRASGLVGLTLGQSNLRASFGVTVVSIVRAGVSVRVLPTATFEVGDELNLVGGGQEIERVMLAFQLERLEAPRAFSWSPEEALAEVVLPRRSRLAGMNLREARFRDRYRATVLGVRRIEAGTSECHNNASLRDLELRAGDTLLLKSRRKYLKNLRDERTDFILMAETAGATGTALQPRRAAVLAVVTLAMLVVMAFGWLPNVVAVLSAALLLVLAGCVRPVEVYRSVNWESVVLVAGMIPLAEALERTGGTRLVVNAAVDHFVGMNPRVILVLLMTITSASGMVLSNTATAVLVAPIAVKLAIALQIAPEPLLMGVAFAASAAFATPIASPVNILVMTPGKYRFVDYTRVGLPLQALVLATAALVIPLVWPF
jgi:di/tricarboxylate transporter